MNEALPSQSCPNAFDVIVRNYVRPLPEKFQTLLSYREGIAELRGKQASFRTIAQLLKRVGVSVSHDTIARFCHVVIEPPPRRKNHRPTIRRASTEPKRESSSASARNAVSPADRIHVSALLRQQRNENETDGTSARMPQRGQRGRGPRIADPKGGVGKSFFAGNFVTFLKDNQIPHLAIDTDNENSTLKRFHRETEFIDIGCVQELDTIFTTLEKNDLVVVDCRAASTEIFLDYFSEVRAFEILETLNAVLTVVSPVNHEADSVEQIKIVVEAFGANSRYVIVRNQTHSEQFEIYDNSQTRRRVLSEFAGREIVMPKLYDWLVTGLNETNLSVTDAIAQSEFSLMDRQRLKNWQGKFYEQIDLARDLLLPNPETPKGKPKKTANPTK